MGILFDTLKAFEDAEAILEACPDNIDQCAKMYKRKPVEMQDGQILQPVEMRDDRIPQYAVTGQYITGIAFYNKLSNAVACWLVQMGYEIKSLHED